MKKSLLVLVSTLVMAALAFAGVYEGRIDGEYHGWDGDTVYKLVDGHIIQQASYCYHYHYAYSPRVIIYDHYGRYKIHVVDDDDNRDVGIIVLK